MNNTLDSLRFLPQALAYIEYEYPGSDIMPMENFIYTGDKMFYLWHARLYKLTQSGDFQCPLVVSPEKTFTL